jgi:hypothetical protein
MVLSLIASHDGWLSGANGVYHLRVFEYSSSNYRALSAQTRRYLKYGGSNLRATTDGRCLNLTSRNRTIYNPFNLSKVSFKKFFKCFSEFIN